MGTDGTFPIISAEKKKTFRLSPVFQRESNKHV